MTITRELPPAPTVSSLFANVARLVAAADPVWGDARLGVRWGLGLPRDGVELAEYTWPLHPTPFPELLARRGGVLVRAHHGDDTVPLRDLVNTGAAAVVAVDSYYLPYRPAFGRVHSGRTLLVRAGPSPDQARVDDLWTPAFGGPVEWNHIDRARRSTVQYDALREPLFSGSPIRGAWYSVEVAPLAPGDPVVWLAGLLGATVAEANERQSDAVADYGLGGWPRLRAAVVSDLLAPPGDEARTHRLRRACLTIRAELSSRAWWVGLVQRAAAVLDDALLAAEGNDYLALLELLQAARDVLAKAVVRPRAEYAAFVAARLDAIAEAEERMAEVIGAAVEIRT